MIFRGKLINIHADSTNKRFMILIIVICLLLLVLVNFFSTYEVPQAFQDLQGLDECPSQQQFYKGFCHKLKTHESNTWKIYVTDLGPKNQFLILGGEIKVTQKEIDFELNFKVEIFKINRNTQQEEKIQYQDNNNIHKTKVKCEKMETFCTQNIFLLFYPQDYKDIYRIQLSFDIPFEYQNSIKEIDFFGKSIQSKFTNFLLIMRYICLGFSVFFGFGYFLFFKQIPKNLLTFEHYYIGLLSIALILFNDPLYAISLLKNELYLTILSNIFIVIFLTLLIFFWVIMMQRIIKETVMVETRLLNCLNLVVFFLIFFIQIATTFATNIFQKLYPGFHINTEFPILYKLFLVSGFIFGMIIILMFFVQSYQIFVHWNRLIPRHRFFFLFSFYFIMILFLLIFNGLNSSYESNGSEILMIFVLNNFYVLMLQFLWRFSDKGVLEFQGFMLDYKNFMMNKDKQKKQTINYFNGDVDIQILRKSDTEIEGSTPKEQQSSQNNLMDDYEPQSLNFSNYSSINDSIDSKQEQELKSKKQTIEISDNLDFSSKRTSKKTQNKEEDFIQINNQYLEQFIIINYNENWKKQLIQNEIIKLSYKGQKPNLMRIFFSFWNFLRKSGWFLSTGFIILILPTVAINMIQSQNIIQKMEGQLIFIDYSYRQNTIFLFHHKQKLL